MPKNLKLNAGQICGMTDEIKNQPDGATPLDDISGLLRSEITTRKQLDQAESLNIINALDWVERGRLHDVFTTNFYTKLHAQMFDQVWEWAGKLRSSTGARPNIGVAPEKVPMELGRVAMEFSKDWTQQVEYKDSSIIEFIARYHHQLVWVHPFNNGNGRWARLACDVVVECLSKKTPITWATDTLNNNSEERDEYIAALKCADDFDYQPLIAYIKSLNPNH